MEIDEALFLLGKGERDAFNAYRTANPQWVPDFTGADLSSFALVGTRTPVNFDKAVLCGAKLPIGVKFDCDGKTPSLREAVIDTKTSGPSLGVLIGLGAVLTSTKQLTKKKEAASIQVFISYAWANSNVVAAIDQWLRQKGLNTKIDKRDFFAGTRIRDEIMRLMKASDVVLIFHSIESKDKAWIEFERELISDIQMSVKREGKEPPRAIYIVIDDTPLPSISEENKLAIIAKGKRFDFVCEEIYHHILRLPRESSNIDLALWQDYVF